jgi:hypothetical protein
LAERIAARKNSLNRKAGGAIFGREDAVQLPLTYDVYAVVRVELCAHRMIATSCYD